MAFPTKYFIFLLVVLLSMTVALEVGINIDVNDYSVIEGRSINSNEAHKQLQNIDSLEEDEENEEHEEAEEDEQDGSEFDSATKSKHLKNNSLCTEAKGKCIGPSACKKKEKLYSSLTHKCKSSK